MIESNAAPRLAAALADRYRVERQLGAGGMATVYLAEDLRHHRRVALKVLRPELAAVIGAERFLHEITTTANLQHPHILALFDSGQVDGTVFYVMPYVEGESLRERLTREKQLPINEALQITREVASALDYAHRHGVIHRDIKPENILLHDGQALVADFGIALAASTAGGTRMTETGMSLGTPHYMSPEQAMGERQLDARTDVYALGCVLYEMLAGEPPFTGPTPQAIVAKVMTDEPRPLTQLRKTVPEPVENAVLTALQKLPADRFGSTAEFAAALGRQADRPAGAPRVRSTPPARWWPRIAAVALSLVAAFWLGGRVLGGRGGPPLLFGRSTQVTSEPGLEVHPAISPDGRFVAYAAGTSADMRVYVRPVAGGRAIPLTGDTTEVQSNPRWSPDGTRVLFLARGGVFSAPASGGPPRPEVPVGRGPAISAADWSPDGRSIAYVVADSLFLQDQGGGRRRLASLLEPSLCTWSPTGKLIACASGNGWYAATGQNFGNLSPSRIQVIRVSDGALTTVSDSTALNHSPVWSPDSRWLYFVSNRHGPRDVYAQRLSSGGQATGAPVRLTAGLGAQSISLSPDGSRLAYALFSATANLWSLPLPSGGLISVRAAIQVTAGSQIIENARVSRDERWLLYSSNLGGNTDVYRLPIAGGEPERLTTDPSDDFSPDLSPDGREVAFHSWRAGSRDIYVMPLDGGPVQRVTSSPRQEYIAGWSPDGKALVFSEVSVEGGIWITRREPDGSWGPPVQRLSTGNQPVWSPDGHRLAYMVGPFAGPLGVIPLDSGPPRILLDPSVPGQLAAEELHWSPDGTTIYFKSHDPRGNASIWSIPTEGGSPRQLVRFDDPTRPSYRANWALGRDRIYFPVEDRQSDIWVMELERR
ncbi:MAG TPA: protein kinase [Gemmatimonadales bacterium]